MKKLLTGIAMMTVAIVGLSQPTIQGSIQQGAAANTVNILYLPDHDNTGQYVNYLSISIAIPTAVATGVNPAIAGVGNFAGLTFTKAIPFSYTLGSETIYSWICSNGTAIGMSWTNGNSFVGATISFAGGNVSSAVRLVDLSSLGGGDNGNSFFAVGVNVAPFDLTNYTARFFSIPGINGNTVGTYPSGDNFIQTTALISLPVGLTSFSGYKEGNKNKLYWSTENETNNAGFDVQRSTDGVNYSSVAFVSSQALNGNSSSRLNYLFEDNQAVGKKQYYRLKQMDIDSRGKFSNIVIINGGKPVRLGIGGLFPNPGTSMLNIIVEVPANNTITLAFFDGTGRIIAQKKVNVATGSNTVPLDISRLLPGNYLIKATGQSGDETASGKFVKQ
jgi:hypothetical protein